MNTALTLYLKSANQIESRRFQMSRWLCYIKSFSSKIKKTVFLYIYNEIIAKGVETNESVGL